MKCWFCESRPCCLVPCWKPRAWSRSLSVGTLSVNRWTLEPIPVGFLGWWQLCTVKNVYALSPGPIGGQRDPCWGWSGLGLRLTVFPDIWSVSRDCFPSFPHLFICALYFPWDFYSWMLCDNFPFHQPTDSTHSTQLIPLCRCLENTWRQAWHSAVSQSHMAEHLCSLCGGMLQAPVSHCTLPMAWFPFFLYRNQIYYLQDLSWGIS